MKDFNFLDAWSNSFISRTHGDIAYLSYWSDPPWCECLGGSRSGLGGQLTILALSLCRYFRFGCSRGLGLHLFAFLLTALQAHIHLVLLLHLAYFRQVETNAVAVEPVVTATAAYHEPKKSTAIIKDVFANEHCEHHRANVTPILKFLFFLFIQTPAHYNHTTEHVTVF